MVQENGRIPKILRHVNFATVRAGVLQDTQSLAQRISWQRAAAEDLHNFPTLCDAKSHSPATFPHNEFRNLAASHGSIRPTALLVLVRMMHD